MSARREQGGHGDGELQTRFFDELCQRLAMAGTPAITERLGGEMVAAEDASVIGIALYKRAMRIINFPSVGR